MAIATFLLLAGNVSAQSDTRNFGAIRASEFKTRNSAAWHNTSRIQTNLNQFSVTRSRFAPRTPPVRRSSSQPVNKPFSTISRGPTVSPYLALSNPRGQVSDYFNIIKPQREQRRLNQQQQRVNQQLLRQNLANQHRLNQLAAEGPFDPRGSEFFAPTGHAAGHMQLGNYLNFGGYFPPPTSPKNE